MTKESLIHLLLNGRVLTDPKMTLHAAGVKQGDVLEVSISDQDTIASLLRPLRMEKEHMYMPQDDVIDPLFLLSTQLLFLQIGRGAPAVPLPTVYSALRYWHPLEDLDTLIQVVLSYCSAKICPTVLIDDKECSMIPEVAFVAIVYMLQHGMAQPPSTLRQLLMVGVLPSVHLPSGQSLREKLASSLDMKDLEREKEEDQDWSWIISLSQIQRGLQVLGRGQAIDNNQLWMMDASIVHTLVGEEVEGKRDEIHTLYGNDD